MEITRHPHCGLCGSDDRVCSHPRCPHRRTDELENPRIVPCDHCGTEGRIYSGMYEDERDCGECPVCKGTGGEIIDAEPITLEDLEVAHADIRAQARATRPPSPHPLRISNKDR